MTRTIAPALGVLALGALLAVSATAPLAAPLQAQAAEQPADTNDVPPRPEGLPSKTWERALVRAMRPSPAGVKWQLNVSETSISATSLREVSEKLAEESRKMMEVRSARSPGSFSWTLSTPWEMETHMSRCQFKNLDVRIGLDLDVVLLDGPVAQDPGSVAAWTRYLDGLWAGHVRRMRVMRDDGKALFQKLRLLSNQSCSEMANIANNHAREARFALNDRLGRMGVRTTPMVDR